VWQPDAVGIYTGFRPFSHSMQTWFSRLLVEDIPDEFRINLPELAKIEAKNFVAETPKVIADLTEQSALDRWYHSETGQATLVALFGRVWQQMSDIAPWAMPAHDARHAIFKVPATALEYVRAEGVSGYERIGVLGALLHDHGRWAEERVFGQPGFGAIHSRLSFLLTRELLAEFDLPHGIASQIMHAVLQHTKGADELDVMPTKLTVSADRDQLYGPEAVLRLMHHSVNAEGDMSSVFGERPGLPVLDRLTSFCVIRLPGPLFSRQAHVDELYGILRDFILMAEPAARSERRFQRQEKNMNGRQALGGRDWAPTWEAAQALRPKANDPKAAFRELLNARQAAPSEEHREAAIAKLDTVPEDCLETLAGALTWVNQQRLLQDARQVKALEEIMLEYPNDRFLRGVAGALLEGISV
jgi:hypothetical protein